jgi:hypothetical protein
MDGIIFLIVCVGVGLLFGGVHLLQRHKAERLDTELTAYVAEGGLSADVARAILATKATTERKREVAALIAEGMQPAEGLALLDAMPAT